MGSRGRDRTVLKFEDMDRVLRFVLNEGSYATCAGVIVQALFAAMGSALSEVLCSLVAAHWESTLEERRGELEADRLVPARLGKISDWIRWIGHVDDKLSQSRILCPSCLNIFQQRTLPPEVGFDCKGTSPQVRFLNVETYYQGNSMTVVPYNANREFALGTKGTQEIARIAPYLGGAGWGPGKVRAYIRQKMATSR